MGLNNKLIQDYKNKKITRAQLSEKTGLTDTAIYSILWKRKIKIWDWQKKKVDGKNFGKDIELYKKRQLTREEIAKRHNIKIVTVNVRLYKSGVEIWDAEKKKTKAKSSRYFNWSELKNSLMCNYNR